nr:uncharacterized protein LOC114924309 [Arachis hypogaea]
MLMGNHCIMGGRNTYILIHVSHLLNGNAVVAFRMISLGALYVTVRIHASVAVNIGGNNINLMLKVPLLTPDLAEAFISLLQGERFSKPNLFCTLGLLVSANGSVD